jgi:hypothetical protein
MFRVIGALLLVGACASGGEGGSSVDGSAPPPPVDARPADIDASVNVGPAGQETVSGAGRLRGGKFTMDVEVGHAIGQKPVGKKDTRLEGATVIKP